MRGMSSSKSGKDAGVMPLRGGLAISRLRENIVVYLLCLADGRWRFLQCRWIRILAVAKENGFGAASEIAAACLAQILAPLLPESPRKRKLH